MARRLSPRRRCLTTARTAMRWRRTASFGARARAARRTGRSSSSTSPPTDAASNPRTWPAPARDYTAALVQRCNGLYQVDDSVYAGAQPLYRMVMLAADRAELNDINRNTGTPPFPVQSGRNRRPDAEPRALQCDVDLRGRHGLGSCATSPACGIAATDRARRRRRISTCSSRTPTPGTGRTALNLNSQNTPWQLLGSALYRKAGLAEVRNRGRCSSA